MLATKEIILNEITYLKKNFFQQLLEKAVECEVIGMEECIAYRDGMAKTILEHAYKVTSEIESNISETRKVVVENHFCIVSLYLFHNFKPSEALLKIKSTSSLKLHAEAVKYYEDTISNSLLELKSFENTINTSKESNFMKNEYNNLIKNLNKALLYDIHIFDITNAYLLGEYQYMSSCDIDFNDVIHNLNLVSNSFMIELSIRSKFNRDAMKKIKKAYFLKYKEIIEGEINRDIMNKENQIKKRITEEVKNKYQDLEKDDPNYSILFGSSKEEWQNEVENAIEELENEKQERYKDIDSMYEIDNILVNTLAVFACDVIKIKYPRFENPDTMPKKYEALKKVPKDILFEEIFSHEEIISFSSKEKEYLQKYLLDNFVSIEE